MYIQKQSPGRLFKISAERGHRGVVGRRALCQDIFIIQKLLICTDSAVVQAL